MKKLIIKSFMITSLFLLIILMIIYNFIANPLYKILEETILENYVNIGESSKKTFENTVTRGLENAKSISSRTMIRRKLTQYRAGLLEIEELKDYTKEKYKDGIKAIDNVIYGVRVADGKIIAEYQDKPDKIDIFKKTENLTYELFNEDEKIFLLVYSPIMSSGVIGMDLIIFDLSY